MTPGQHLPRDEFLRRIRAAMGYIHLTNADLARQLHMSPQTLQNWFRPHGVAMDDRRRRQLIEQVAGNGGLPPEFFDADLSRLAEIQAEDPALAFTRATAAAAQLPPLHDERRRGRGRRADDRG